MLTRCHDHDKSAPMPPAAGASRQRNAINGTGGDPQAPPSSSVIAAHLAPTNGTNFPQFDPKDFDLLLNESLGSDEDGQPNLGPDVTLNHKLICVILKAGIDTIDLRDDDPFRKNDEDLGQIQKCLEVIHLAVERTPEALFVLLKSDDFGSRAENVPLFLWIIPKLLSLLLLAEDHSKPVADRIWSLLDKVVLSEEQCSNSFEHCLSISDYIQDVVEGIAYWCY